MLVHAAVEQRRRVFPNRRLDQRPATRVLGHKRRNIVDDACDGDERGPLLLAAGFEVVPVNDRELGEGHTPVEGVAFAVERFLLLLQAAFFYFVAAEGFEVVGLREDGEVGEEVDEPFCGVVLVPDYGVAWALVSGLDDVLGRVAW